MDSIDDILAHMEEQRRQAEAVQMEMQRMEVTGRSRDGQVHATVRGTGQFTSIRIDARIIQRYSPEGVGQLVLEAVNDGMRRLAEATRARFEPLIAAAEATVPPLPDMR